MKLFAILPCILLTACHTPLVAYDASPTGTNLMTVAASGNDMEDYTALHAKASQICQLSNQKRVSVQFAHGSSKDMYLSKMGYYVMGFNCQ